MVSPPNKVIKKHPISGTYGIFFSKVKINQLSKGFKIINIEKFEECSFTRKLFKVILKKK